MSNLLAFHIFLASLETSHQCGRMVIWYDSCWFQQFSPLEKLLDIKIIQLVIALVEVYPLTINLIRKGHKKRHSMASKETNKLQPPMNWHLSSYHPFPPSLFWILRILSASLVNILGTSLKVLQDCKTGRFISILTPACLLEQKQQGVLQLQLRLCFTEMYRNVKILHAPCLWRPTANIIVTPCEDFPFEISPLQRPHRNRKDQAAIGSKILLGFHPTSRAAWVTHVGCFDVNIWLSTIIIRNLLVFFSKWMHHHIMTFISQSMSLKVNIWFNTWNSLEFFILSMWCTPFCRNTRVRNLWKPCKYQTHLQTLSAFIPIHWKSHRFEAVGYLQTSSQIYNIEVPILI